RRVVDDAFERVGQAEKAAQPGKRDLFEFGRGGRRPPEHRLLIKRGREKFGEHAGGARRRRKVREKSRMVPVRQGGDQYALEVLENILERLAMFGSVVRQRVANVARRDARQDRITLGPTQVGGDPLHQRVAVAPKLSRIHELTNLRIYEFTNWNCEYDHS